MTFISIIWHDDELRKAIKNHKDFKDENTQKEIVIGSKEVAKNFMSSFFIFFTQVFLTTLMFKYFLDKWKQTTNDDVDFSVLVTRLLAAIILHLQIESEIH